MRLSWNEVRARAAAFADEWQDACYEKGETQSFYNAFFDVFGVRRRNVARYEEHVSKLDNHSGFIDLFWPGVLLVEQKSAGRDLKAAYEQAGEYFDALPERDRPRYILVSDFQTFELHDLDEREIVEFPLVDLPAHVEAFGFILGVQRRPFRDQDPANIEAAELVGRLHDALEAAGHRGHDLERFLVRVVFCLFADDTGLFEPRDIFLDFIETRTGEDGADLGPWLTQLFEVLDTPEDERAANLDEDLDRFPYVNGDLFRGHLRTFSFDAAMRGALLDASRFDWSNISPAIFGALFQSVMDPEERRAQGAHYTTEKNILKVIEPLFMDDLRAEFERLRARRGRGRLAALRQFQAKLGGLTFFDPACGCGNFLIIAYRELRELEIEVLREIYPKSQMGRQMDALASDLSVVDVDQFYGIEFGEFPARIAETVLWMMDHIMNNRLSLEFGQTYARIPLEKSPHIVHGDALETDWSGLLLPDECSFVFGNPPFVGAKYQTPGQREQVRGIAALGKSGGTLDYVTAWFIRAGGVRERRRCPNRFRRDQLDHAGRAGRATLAGPVRTLQAGDRVRSPDFCLGIGRTRQGACARCHSRPRPAGGRASREAAVQLSRHQRASRRKAAMRLCRRTLFDAGGLSDPHLVVREESAPINGLGRLIIGSKPIDGGNYIFDAAERAAFLEAEPEAAPYLRPYVGAREYLQGGERCILALHDTPPEVLTTLPRVRERIASVRAYREASKSAPTRKLAATPTLYHVNVIPGAPFLAIPEVSSERREYTPIGWLEPPVIPSNLVRILSDATLVDFALLTSAMHMAWLRHIGGRLKSDYRYSIGLVYNSFPLPPKDADLSRLDRLAQAVLDARGAHAGATLADLYDPDLMPPDLRKAHQALDRAVDRLYRRPRFGSERERVEHLFMLYERMFAPLIVGTKTKKKQRKEPR